jgi:hypothetical protein
MRAEDAPDHTLDAPHPGSFSAERENGARSVWRRSVTASSCI